MLCCICHPTCLGLDASVITEATLLAIIFVLPQWHVSASLRCCLDIQSVLLLRTMRFILALPPILGYGMLHFLGPFLALPCLFISFVLLFTAVSVCILINWIGSKFVVPAHRLDNHLAYPLSGSLSWRSLWQNQCRVGL